MPNNTLIVDSAKCWSALNKSLLSLSAGKARSVKFVESSHELSSDPYTIEIVVKHLGEGSGFELSIFGKSILNFSNEVIGNHLAGQLSQDVIVPSESTTTTPRTWVRISPDGHSVPLGIDFSTNSHQSTIFAQRTTAPTERLVS